MKQISSSGELEAVFGTTEDNSGSQDGTVDGSPDDELGQDDLPL